MRIKVDTDALLDIARQYERLSLELNDVGGEINRTLAALTSALPGEDYVLERIVGITRKCDTLKGEIDGSRVKLRYAARAYEETDKQLRRLSRDYARNFGNNGREE